MPAFATCDPRAWQPSREFLSLAFLARIWLEQGVRIRAVVSHFGFFSGTLSCCRSYFSGCVSFLGRKLGPKGGGNMGEFSKVRSFFRSCCYLLTLRSGYVLKFEWCVHCIDGDLAQVNLGPSGWSVHLSDGNVSCAEIMTIILLRFMINSFLSVNLVHSI